MALRKTMNETNRNHFQKELQTAKKNPKRTWEIIKEIAQCKDIKEEKKFENPLETATNFNTFFTEIGAKVFDEVFKFTTHKPVDVGLNPAQLLNTTNTWKPNPWQHSIIKPLHKAAAINTASNYRPISLLPVLSKILEKVISNQL
ncbi:hypothetical protein FHG87_025358, partial [Trinorchestia longiramus]